MLAARFKEAGKPFVVEEVDTPKIGPGEVLVEVTAAGICGSDVHFYTGEFKPAKIPLIVGHEGAGIVREVGEGVTHLKEGDHVVLHYVLSCGNCKNCMMGYDNRCRNRLSLGYDIDGTFAEYIKIPARSAIKMADHIPLEWGAITACAVSTAYHAVTVAGFQRGDTVVVFGVGGVGLHAVLWARYFGAGKVIAVDLVDSKLEAARKYGADVVVNPEREDVLKIVERETDGWGAAAAIECSGSPRAMEQAIKAIKGKNLFESGTVVSVGLQTKPFQADFWGLREGRLTVSGDHTRNELRQIIRLIEAGRIDLSESITHRVPLEEVNRGVQLVKSRAEHVERVIIDIHPK
jgi:propanol-preferring alcohol dehydrogenase